MTPRRTRAPSLRCMAISAWISYAHSGGSCAERTSFRAIAKATSQRITRNALPDSQTSITASDAVMIGRRFTTTGWDSLALTSTIDGATSVGLVSTFGVAGIAATGESIVTIDGGGVGTRRIVGIGARLSRGKASTASETIR